jgi:hypothetical protein
LTLRLVNLAFCFFAFMFRDGQAGSALTHRRFNFMGAILLLPPPNHFMLTIAQIVLERTLLSPLYCCFLCLEWSEAHDQTPQNLNSGKHTRARKSVTACTAESHNRSDFNRLLSRRLLPLRRRRRRRRGRSLVAGRRAPCCSSVALDQLTHRRLVDKHGRNKLQQNMRRHGCLKLLKGDAPLVPDRVHTPHEPWFLLVPDRVHFSIN